MKGHMMIKKEDASTRLELLSAGPSALPCPLSLSFFNLFCVLFQVMKTECGVWLGIPQERYLQAVVVTKQYP